MKPQAVKDELAMLHWYMEFEKDRYLKAIQPYMERICTLENCYPDPILVTRDVFEKVIGASRTQ